MSRPPSRLPVPAPPPGVPHTAAGARQPLAPSVSVAPRGPGLSVLVVDDEPDMLGLLGQLVALALPEARLRTAESGERALEFLRRDNYDLLVTDFRMPGMDGLELAGRAKALHPLIKRVMLTAFADSSFGGPAIANGTIDQLFKKPVDPLILVAALRAMVAS